MLTIGDIIMSKKQESGENNHPEKKTVEITVNSQEKEIEKGKYLVSFLKEQWEIPADHELNLIKNGQINALSNDETIEIHDGDEFCSQVKSGGAA